MLTMTQWTGTMYRYGLQSVKATTGKPAECLLDGGPLPDLMLWPASEGSSR
jgi:hypothetical protein